jgi:hypothetical protein
MKYRVCKSYQSPYADALNAAKGETLSFERKPTEWSGWIWCTNKSNKSAWVPESWVVIKGNNCQLKQDYDARELPVESGAEVVGELVESGWVWVRNQNGAEGWVPLENLEVIELTS